VSRWRRRRAGHSNGGEAALGAPPGPGATATSQRPSESPPFSQIPSTQAVGGLNGNGNGTAGVDRVNGADGAVFRRSPTPPAAREAEAPVVAAAQAGSTSPAPQRPPSHVDRLRDDYDHALTEAGVVLVQQAAPGVDRYHVSSSVTAVLGWDPTAFLRPGVLRSVVHPADLSTFDRHLPIAPSAPVDPWVEADAVIDLTGDAGATTRAGGSLPARQRSTPGRAEGAAPPPPPVVRFRTSAGEWRWLQLRITPNEPGVEAPLRGSLVDVTADEQARITSRRFAELIEHDPSACLVLEFLDRSDPTSLVIRSANRSAHRMFDLDRRVVDGTPVGEVLGEASAQLVRHALFDVCHTGQSMTAERLSLGEVRGTYLDLRVDRLSDGTLGMTVTDVTGTVALEERLRHQASHDALTGLPNRALLEERLAAAATAATVESPIALVVADVDRLREVNERLGLHLGDQLLVEMGRRLVREVRGAAVVSRLGGDEFAVLTMPCANQGEARERAVAVREALSRPFDVEGHLVECRTSIGVALAPAHAEDGRSLLRAAHDALDVAKRSGGFAVYEPTGAPSSISRLALLGELRQGLANQDLELHYQPIVDLRTGHVTKVEAVLRWHDDRPPSRLPLDFLELAEQSGLIRPLTRWVVGEVVAAATALAQAGAPLVVATNLSVRNLFDQDLEAFLTQLVDSGELPTELVELEVAETELMDDPGRAQETLTRLHGLGVRFVVDEFGTGYTSLSTMEQLSVSGLKIDPGFVSAVATDESDAAIVRSTVELAHEAGLVVAADGVPDEATLSLLASFGCDLAQGAHLSEPVTLAALPRRIAELEDAARGWLGSVEATHP